MYQEIQNLLDQIGPYPQKPTKPVLRAEAKVEDIRKHADDFEIYEKEFAEFEKKRIEYYNNKAAIEGKIKDLIKESAGLNSIPEQYRDKAWAKAWENGHSSGFYDVYLELCDLVDIFS